MDNARVMTPLHHQRRTLPGRQGNRLLRPCNGGRRAHRHGKQDRHSVGNAAVDSACAVGLRADGVPVQADRIVGLAAIQIRKSKAVAERHSLDRRDCKEVL